MPVPQSDVVDVPITTIEPSVFHSWSAIGGGVDPMVAESAHCLTSSMQIKGISTFFAAGS